MMHLPVIGILGSGGSGSPLLDDLISWWSMDEATGIGARVDSHGSNNLTPNFPLNGVAGKINNAVEFPGGTNAFWMIAESILSIDSDFSTSMWVKWDTITGTNKTPIGFTGSGGTEAKFYIDVLNTNLRSFILSTQFDGDAAIVSISADTWYHIVSVYDSTASTLKIYVDSILEATISVTGAMMTTLDIRVGVANPSEGRWMDGLVDELGLWNAPINEDAISELYNSGNGIGYPG